MLIWLFSLDCCTIDGNIKCCSDGYAYSISADDEETAESWFLTGVADKHILTLTSESCNNIILNSTPFHLRNTYVVDTQIGIVLLLFVGFFDASNRCSHFLDKKRPAWIQVTETILPRPILRTVLLVTSMPFHNIMLLLLCSSFRFLNIFIFIFEMQRVLCQWWPMNVRSAKNNFDVTYQWHGFCIFELL